jgi:hypothetical protein
LYISVVKARLPGKGCKAIVGRTNAAPRTTMSSEDVLSIRIVSKLTSQRGKKVILGRKIKRRREDIGGEFSVLSPPYYLRIVLL